MALVSTIVFATVFDWALVTAKVRYRSMPFTLYSALGFTTAAVIALPIRILRNV